MQRRLITFVQQFIEERTAVVPGHAAQQVRADAGDFQVLGQGFTQRHGRLIVEFDGAVAVEPQGGEQFID